MISVISPMVSNVTALITILMSGFNSNRVPTMESMFPEEPPMNACVGVGSPANAGGAIPDMVTMFGVANLRLFHSIKSIAELSFSIA